MSRSLAPRAIAAVRTPLVGRDSEVGLVVDLLSRADIRVVTVTGPGGIGKTVVAEAACRLLAARTPMPVQTIALQSRAQGALLEPLVAALSGASPDAGPLPPPVPPGRRRIVLVDGAETSPDAADAVSAALDDDSGLVVLATSVVPLGIRGEHVVRLGPLGVPDDGARDVAAIGASPAVSLFCSRLAAADPDFELDASHAAAVAELCRRLEGHPLALELAAARCATSTVAAVLEHLERASLLVVLKHGARDVEPRHRSLGDTIEWSVRLLDEDQRDLLRRACVCTGSFTWAALVAIVAAGDDAGSEGDTIAALTDDLDVLVATGMIRRVAGDRPAEADRYAIPAAVRDYVAPLGADPDDLDDLRRRHASYYRDLARRCAAGQWSGGRGRAARELVVEQHGLLQAFQEVGNTGDVASALAFAVDLEPVWIGIGATATAVRTLEDLLERARASGAAAVPQALVAEAMASMAALTLWSRNADLGAAHRARLSAAVELARAVERPDLVLRTMATALLTSVLAGEADEARATADAAIELAASLGDDWWRMRLLSLSATAANQAGEARLATEHAVAARDLARALGDEHQLVLTSHVLTGIPGAARDPQAAVPSPDDLLAMARRLGDVQVEGMVLISTAVRHGMGGRPADAARDLRGALDLGRRSGFWYLEELALFVLVPMAVAASRHAEAARLSGALHDVLVENRRRMPPGPVAAYDAALTAARAALGAEVCELLDAGGRLLGWSEALREADALVAALAAAGAGEAAAVGGHDDDPAGSARPEHSFGLTNRELEVLRRVSLGASNKDIAFAMGLRPKTVMHYTGAIYRKLGVGSRAEAVTVAWNAGLLSPAAGGDSETA